MSPKIIAWFLLGCVLWSMAAPAYAGVVARQPLTKSEDAALATQQTQDADQLAQVAGGDGLVILLAAVGLIAIIVLVAREID